MQSSVPLQFTNLNLIFQQYDTDQDGQVNDSEVQKILKQVGYKDIYIGTIRKVIRLLNLENTQRKNLNYSQVQEFAEAMVTEGKFKIWKAKYKLKQNIREVQEEIYGKQENGAAAPGAGPESAPTPAIHHKSTGNHEASIRLKSGNSTMYNQRISLKLQKQKGPQSIFSSNSVKPFIKFSIERNTYQEAKQIEKLFKEIYDALINIIKVEQQWLVPDIQNVSFITNVQEKTFTLFVTSSNQGLNQLIQLGADYFDQVFKQPVNGKIQGSFQFNFDFMKFLTEPSYNFYDIVVKDSKFELQWNLWELFGHLRQLALKTDLLKDLEWNPNDYFSLFMVNLLHIEKFTGNVEFQNTPTENQETKSKEILARWLKDFRNDLQEIQNSSQVKVLELAEQIDGKIRVEAGVRDWKFNFEADLKNFNKLFTQNVEGYN